jgi:hypothetical protein
MSIHPRQPLIRDGRARKPMHSRAGFQRAGLWTLLCLLATGGLIGLARAGPGDGDKPPSHWSFQPLGRPIPPRTHNAAWLQNPIDAFVLRTLEDQGLEPAQPASPATLPRRACFDLRGLSPSPEEI